MRKTVSQSLVLLACLSFFPSGFAFAQSTGDKDKPPMTAPASAPAASQPKYTNRLSHATSPYLRQHAHNPVDWYEWGSEALEKAKKEDKPIFLSIGYSACHWCHVMAHESFENEEIAAVMNKHFINVKVDREERPDIDEIYMQAAIAYTGGGGWPMSVWLTPDLKPFVAGTYFPPTAKWGRAGFKEICEQIGELWKTRRADIEGDAGRMAEYLKTRFEPASRPATNVSFSLEVIDKVAELIAGAFDGAKGGLRGGGTNKFPPSMAMDLLLRSVQRHRAENSRTHQRFVELTRLTLDKMAAGGIYDHLGGGIARYSTDVDWLVPHFEKMLYDQALVSRIYLDAYQYTGDKLYARVAGEIFDYVIGDLQSSAGGFYSTRDADSEGEEGKYYVWTKAQVFDVLGKEDAVPFCAYYDVTEVGNWDDPHHPGAAKSILHVPRDLAAVAQAHNLAPEELEKRLAAARKKMLAARAQRVPPHRDEKILCEWNGLMISSLARGGSVLGEKKYVEAAARAANFILEKQYKNGRLLRSYLDGRTLNLAFLSDYAAMIEGLLELYEATFEKRWLDKALELNAAVMKHYWDEKDGGFFVAAHDHETPLARSKEVSDNAVPSGNSIQLMNLLRLAALLGDEKLRAVAERMIVRFAPDVLDSPGMTERFLCGVEFALAGPVEIAVIGDPADPRTQALLKKIHATYLPNRVILLENPALTAKQPAEKINSPLLQGRTLVDGQPAVYVCRNYACKLPATTPEELEKQLK